MMAASSMQVNIVAADHPVWAGQAKSVVIPAYEGAMGILPDHQPILTLFKEGVVTVTDMNDEKHEFEVTDGFISFDSNKLTVAVERGRDVVRRAGDNPEAKNTPTNPLSRPPPHNVCARGRFVTGPPVPRTLFRSREAAGRGMGYGGGLCES